MNSILKIFKKNPKERRESIKDQSERATAFADLTGRLSVLNMDLRISDPETLKDIIQYEISYIGEHGKPQTPRETHALNESIFSYIEANHPEAYRILQSID